MKPWLVTVLPLVVLHPVSQAMSWVALVLCVVAVVWAVKDGRSS